MNNKAQNNKNKNNTNSDKLISKNIKALIITNGIINDYNLILKRIAEDYKFDENTLTIAADGGARNCINMRIVPDLIIGDMDSITIKLMENLKMNSKTIKFINTSPEKDESDTQLALDFAINAGVKQVLVVGAIGGRIDHSLANLILLAAPNYNNADVRIITENSEIFMVKKSCSINGTIGKKISIFSLTPFTYFESTSGLKYRLKNERLYFSPVRGLSNEFIKTTAKISIGKGEILLFKEI